MFVLTTDNGVVIAPAPSRSHVKYYLSFIKDSPNISMDDFIRIKVYYLPYGVREDEFATKGRDVTKEFKNAFGVIEIKGYYLWGRRKGRGAIDHPFVRCDEIVWDKESDLAEAIELFKEQDGLKGVPYICWDVAAFELRPIYASPSRITA